jgi:hypothetical protein
MMYFPRGVIKEVTSGCGGGHLEGGSRRSLSLRLAWGYIVGPCLTERERERKRERDRETPILKIFHMLFAAL